MKKAIREGLTPHLSIPTKARLQTVCELRVSVGNMELPLTQSGENLEKNKDVLTRVLYQSKARLT